MFICRLGTQFITIFFLSNCILLIILILYHGRYLIKLEIYLTKKENGIWLKIDVYSTTGLHIASLYHCSWDETYSRELQNYKDHGDIGTVW